jgi:hypothetical protein
VSGVRALPILGRVFLGLGLLGFLAAGVLTIIESRGGRSAHTEGVVVAADSRALVEFTTDRGETVRFRNNVASTTTNERDRLQVAYDPRNPDDARVDGIAGRWLLRDLATILGGVFFWVGVGMLFLGRQLIRRTP